jgi:hypothetical protein
VGDVPVGAAPDEDGSLSIGADHDTAMLASPGHVAVLLYALTGGVLWWVFHLTALSVTEPAVCDGLSHLVLTGINVVSVLGVLSALAASFVAGRADTRPGGLTGRSRFLGRVAVLFNVASLALVVLESVPVYVLGACS